MPSEYNMHTKQTLLFILLTCFLCLCSNSQKSKNETKVKNIVTQKYILNKEPVKKQKEEKEPTYQETADWIVSKLKLYAKGYERKEHFKSPDFEVFYPNVRVTYDDFKIQYGKLFFFKNYRYYGGNLDKENKYKGFIIRQNIQEIPINDIVDFKLKLEGFRLNSTEDKFCNMGFITQSETVKVTRNMQITTTASEYDLDAPKPITEYNDKGGLFIRCEIEEDLKNRMDKALKHLKKLNLERYPATKEAF